MVKMIGISQQKIREIVFLLLSNLATVPSMRTTRSLTTFRGSCVNCFNGVPLTVFHRMTVPSSEAL